MTKGEEIRDYLDSIGVTTLTADGFDDAIMGVTYDMQVSEHRIVYSVCKCLNVLMERDGMSHEEAQEYFDFNVSGAHVGSQTPVWVDDSMFEE